MRSPSRTPRAPPADDPVPNALNIAAVLLAILCVWLIKVGVAAKFFARANTTGLHFTRNFFQWDINVRVSEGSSACDAIVGKTVTKPRSPNS